MKNKKNLVGTRINDAVVIDYDEKGVFVRDDNGNEEYVRDEAENPMTVEEEVNTFVDYVSSFYENDFEMKTTNSFNLTDKLYTFDAMNYQLFYPFENGGYEMGDNEYPFKVSEIIENDDDNSVRNIATTKSSVTDDDIVVTSRVYLDGSKVVVTVECGTVKKTITVTLRNKIVVYTRTKNITVA